MFKHILVPVDLLHVSSLRRALDVAALEARLHNAELTYVSVTIRGPSRVASGPEDFARKLDEFVAGQMKTHGIKASAKAIFSHDPTTDVDDALVHAITDLGADLVVMASHKPGFGDFFWPSNGSVITRRTDASVFIVRQA